MVKEVYKIGTLLIDIFNVGAGIYLGLTENKLYHIVYDFRKNKIEELLDFSFKAVWRKA